MYVCVKENFFYIYIYIYICVYINQFFWKLIIYKKINYYILLYKNYI